MIIISEAGHLTCREPIEFQFDYLGGPWENWVSESCQMVYKTWPNIVLPLSKCMGFAHKGLWGMAYHRFMGYGMQFLLNYDRKFPERSSTPITPFSYLYTLP